MLSGWNMPDLILDTLYPPIPLWGIGSIWLQGDKGKRNSAGPEC